MTPSNELRIRWEKTSTLALVYAATGRPHATFVLAHGAGAGQRSPFIVAFAKAIAGLGVDVVTFDFPYIGERRKAPDRGSVLEACYLAVVGAVRAGVDSAREHLFIGGKSMGGRIATQVTAADRELPVMGLVLLGYPLHPPGRPAELRTSHLASVRRPMLFVQGTRDGFGTPDELKPVFADLSPAPTLHVVDGGDHSFKISRGGREVQTAVYDDVQRTVAEWMRAVAAV